MKRTALVVSGALCAFAVARGVSASEAAPAAAPAASHLTAAQIVEKNVAARGGLSAWHGVQTMVWRGKMTAGASTYETMVKGKLQTKTRDEAQLPFTFEFKRPQKTRLELQFNGQTAVQVFDGAAGWKLRPYLNRPTWDAYTAEEAKQAAAEPGIDGYLIDYAARGSRVELVGTEKVENQNTYKLKVTLANSEVHHVWVDSRTFLEAKIEGLPRKLDGKSHPVEIFLRDFRREGGVVIPHLMETRVVGVRRTEKITIESALVNQKLEDSRFTKAS